MASYQPAIFCASPISTPQWHEPPEGRGGSRGSMGLAITVMGETAVQQAIVLYHFSLAVNPNYWL